MEYNIIGVIILIGWVLSGIHLLDDANVHVKWNRERGSTAVSRRELFLLFLGPVMFVIEHFRDFFERYFLVFFRRVQHRVKNNIDLQIIDARGMELYADLDSINPAVDALKRMLFDAIASRTSDIFIDPQGKEKIMVRFRVDGALQNIMTLDTDAGENIINAVKVAAGMDIAEKRRPQDGAFAARSNGCNAAFRVASVGAYGGEKLTIRLLGTESGPSTLEEAGFSGDMLQIMKNSVKLNSGMILICGATGSGKTTTLYALLKNIDYSFKNVISIEDPIEKVIENVSQMEVNPKADITFAKLLRNALRQNPDVICLGEIRDEETAQIAVRAAQTGHLIISTVHSNDNLDTIDRMCNLGVPLRSLAATAKVILSQRLARRLCDHCKEPGVPDERWRSFFEQNGIPVDGICRPVGCPECNHTGYRGRVALFDLLIVDKYLRAALEDEHATLSSVRLAMENNQQCGSIYLHGAELASQGITSLDEIDRLTLVLGE